MTKVERELIELLKKAKFCVILAGAGMGADSGLATFRTNGGFWQQHPEFSDKKLSFRDVANPNNYEKYPEITVPFYKGRLKSYLNTEPHGGYYALLGIAETLSKGYFVWTTNVDGHFEKAGFKKENILEEHGSIYKWQCSRLRCAKENHLTDYSEIIDSKEPPLCDKCGSLLRPNLCMFMDFDWLDSPYQKQEAKQRFLFQGFIERFAGDSILIIEIGAGKDLPKMRFESEYLAKSLGTKVIRINPDIDEHEDNLVLHVPRLKANESMNEGNIQQPMAGADEALTYLLELYEKHVQ